MPSLINRSIFKLIKRAEKYDREHLVNTFVDVGPLFALLVNPDHQIIYGRRGTGKTHALTFLKNEIESKGFACIYVDMRNIGSNGGIYSDSLLSITERATRLLVDTLSVVHEQLLDYVLSNDDKCDLSRFGPILDELAISISEVVVVGNVEVEESKSDGDSHSSSFGLSVSQGAISARLNQSASKETMHSSRKTTTGNNLHRVHFTTISHVFHKIKNLLLKDEVWILIDEWAEVPLDLQPFLADLLRRSLFSINGITVKIAAIEKRTNFKLALEKSYIGIETGADISASLNLDEFMVFDNDPEKSKNFFKNLIFNHVNEFLKTENASFSDVDSFISSAFTQIGSFEELVRASEGIPRDAINILVQSAIKADIEKISIPNIRSAARYWYNADKENSVLAKVEAKLMLRWIIDEVIAGRNSRAFLLSTETQDEVIEYLFDNRILHLIKQNISSKDMPGERFHVYAIDYGTYVHLINTTDEPKGLFMASENDEEEIFIEVPLNDYRSIRRSILYVDKFWNQINN